MPSNLFLSFLVTVILCTFNVQTLVDVDENLVLSTELKIQIVARKEIL